MDFFTTSVFWSIISIWFWAVIMPGADMFLVIRSAVSYGKKCAYFAAAGIVIGTVIWLIVGFFFIQALSKTPFFKITQIIGGFYLIYMAWQILASLIKQKTSNSDSPAQINKSPKKSLMYGILTNLSNPKPPIFVGVILSKIPHSISLDTSLVLLLIMTIIPSLWFSFVVKIFSIERFFKVFMRYSKWIDTVVVVVFGGFGMSLIYDGINTLL